jgi:hypothetical protein
MRALIARSRAPVLHAWAPNVVNSAVEIMGGARESLRHLAEETLGILDAGFYECEGKRIEIGKE